MFSGVRNEIARRNPREFNLLSANSGYFGIFDYRVHGFAGGQCGDAG
jgi:hypothetical protein